MSTEAFPRRRRPAVLPTVLPAMLPAVLLTTGLAGCAELRSPPPGQAQAGCTGAPGTVQLLPWMTLTGGALRSDPALLPRPGLGLPPAALGLPSLPGGLPGTPNRPVLLRYPTAVAAGANDVFVADSAQRTLFRFDRVLMAPTPFAALPPGNITGLFLGRDLSVYVVDSVGARILQFNRGGTPVQALENQADLPRPVDVYVAEETGRLYVADALRNHILVLDRLGGIMGVIGAEARRPAQFRSLIALAGGPDGLYALDRLDRQVHVFGLDGVYRYSLGEEDLALPAALAVDRDNRVYVADAQDSLIKVFFAGQKVAEAGGRGAGPGRFQQVSDLWVDESTLYVADALNARVQLLQVVPCTSPP